MFLSTEKQSKSLRSPGQFHEVGIHEVNLQLLVQSAAWVNFPRGVLENAAGLGEVGTVKYLNKVTISSEVRMFVSRTLAANSSPVITGKRKAFIISSPRIRLLIGPSSAKPCFRIVLLPIDLQLETR